MERPEQAVSPSAANSLVVRVGRPMPIRAFDGFGEVTVEGAQAPSLPLGTRGRLLSQKRLVWFGIGRGDY